MAHNSLSMYFVVYSLLHCHTIVQMLHTVNNIGVTSSGILPVGMVLRNPAVEYNVAAFSELSFAACW